MNTQQRNKISATIITFNEESNIEKCLQSLSWVDEILIVDSFSTDKTIEICKKYNCKIIQTEWQGFGNTKKFAVDNAENQWIFSVDADEEISDQLKLKIQEILTNPQCDGYNIKRRSYYLGKEIKYCGWDKDFPLRLFNRNKGNFNVKEVHESVVINGKKCKIYEPIFHYTYPNLSLHISKMNRYSDISSQQIRENKNYSIISSIVFGIAKFLRMYFLQRGFLDGKVGFVLCFNSAFGVYLKYIKIWHKKN
ncbi:MAG: glycosyltransferase family 2 protein [Ignavibacteriae bacterium]|nr:glycosyltransferase family 2 protein [Ignavibacteriota bacterium]MCB9206845.1 glycosyltransferase family 2 protein [Ignavibacteriales bacterium]MCB9210146.1 glycosyltransferase family 2 protein [Ignavibacteriales bacterium]MCB9218469.1 glycosyltransferase family 2 protein [Ignavibacteriales bacterium]MCB9259525.1 glycosyltransferase family 2 protein [Ignavibacteriales bacterium]